MEILDKYRKQLAAGVVFLLVFPLFFQLSGQIYNDISSTGMVDSGGSLILAPLPISLIASYVAIFLFSDEIYRSKPIVLTIAFILIFLLVSSLVAGYGVSKLILLAQFIVPVIALPLGLAFGNYDRKLIAQVFLYFLLFFAPLQLLCTWIEGQFALTHYLYLFSVYQHYQYVPLVFTCMFLWTWIDLQYTHKTWIYMLAPWIGMYIAAGNSLTALFGLIAFALCFSIMNCRSRSAIMTTIILTVFASGYLFLNFQIPHEFKKHRHGLFVGKFANSNRHFNIPENPANVSHRLVDWKYYAKGITESPLIMLFGHESPPPRSKTTSAHNYYLDLAYNFGVLAWLPIFLLMFYTIYRLTKCRGNSAALWWTAIVFYILLIDNNLKVGLRQPYPGLFAFFLWGVLISVLSDQKQNSEDIV